MRRWAITNLVVVSVLGLVGAAGWFLNHPTPDVVQAVVGPIPSDRLTPSDRLVAAGKTGFWAGVNYPWKTGRILAPAVGDTHAGVSDATTYREIDADFANMAAQGIRVVKWRIFSDARYGVQFDDAGTVTGLDTTS